MIEKGQVKNFAVKVSMAALGKGRSAKYPYYLCYTKGCVDYRKSIRMEKIEGEFAVLLAGLKPNANLFAMAFEMFRDIWQEKLQSAEDENVKRSAILGHRSDQIM